MFTALGGGWVTWKGENGAGRERHLVTCREPDLMRGIARDLQEQRHPKLVCCCVLQLPPPPSPVLQLSVIQSNIVLLGFGEMKRVSRVEPDKLPRGRTADNRTVMVRAVTVGNRGTGQTDQEISSPKSRGNSIEGYGETFHRMWAGNSQYFTWIWWSLQPGELGSSITYLLM